MICKLRNIGNQTHFSWVWATTPKCWVKEEFGFLMKRLFQEDLKIYLSNVLMALMAVVVLELAFAFGVFTKNKGLAATALQLFLYVLVVLLVMFFVMAGKAFYQKLGNAQYYPVKKEQGYSSCTLLGGLTLMYTLFFFALALIYILMIGLDVAWCTRAFPEEREGLTSIVNKLFEGGNRVLLITAEFIDFFMIAFSFTALLYFSVTMAYNLFTKSRYSGFLAAIFFALLSYAVATINIKVTNVSNPVQQHFLSAVVQLGFSVIFLAVTLSSLKKHEWIDEPH